MNVIQMIKAVPRITRAKNAIDTFLAAKDATTRSAATEDLVLALLPLIEGMIGRDVVDDEKAGRLAHELVVAFVDILDFYRDVEGKLASKG